MPHMKTWVRTLDRPSLSPRSFFIDVTNGSTHQASIGRSYQFGRNLRTVPRSKQSIPRMTPMDATVILLRSGMPFILMSYIGRNIQAPMYATSTARRGLRTAKMSRAMGIHAQRANRAKAIMAFLAYPSFGARGRVGWAPPTAFADVVGGAHPTNRRYNAATMRVPAPPEFVTSRGRDGLTGLFRAARSKTASNPSVA